MTGDVDTTSNEIKTTISFVFIGVSEKNAGNRLGGQFVRRGGVDVWNTETANTRNSV